MISPFLWMPSQYWCDATERMSSCLIPWQRCSDPASSSPLPQGGMWSCLMPILFNSDVTLCRAHRIYVILFDPRTMSIWLCLVVAAPTGSELYCLILLQCRSDSASSSSTFHRRYVVLFDPWTMTIWHCLAAPTEGMLYCLIQRLPLSMSIWLLFFFFQ